MHAASFAAKCAAISGGVTACIRYACGIRGELDFADELQVRERFREDLRRLAPRERERGQTLSGPHRDELAFMFNSGENEVDLREFGSGEHCA